MTELLRGPLFYVIIMTAANGTASKPKWANGPGVPLTTPFKPGCDEVDHEALAKQVVRCAKAGLTIVLLGTTGESNNLSAVERKAVTVTGRKALDDAGLHDHPLVVGCGGGSVQITVGLCKDAAEAGASHALVIASGYFAFMMGGNKASVVAFFKAVMDKSPIPVMIYNFPGAASGIDLNSSEICELADHPNCFGVKLTCCNIGKGTRIVTYTSSPEFLKRKGDMLKSCTVTGQFQVGPGLCDIFLPALIGGHTMVITSAGCVFPKTIRKLYDLSIAGINGDNKALKEAQVVQARLARSDAITVVIGFSGLKHLIDAFVGQGLGGDCRLPVPMTSDAVKKQAVSDLAEDWEYEQSLP